ASAGQAVTATMVRELDAVRPVREVPIRVEADEPERLVHRFLEEVVYRKDAEQLLLASFEVKVSGGPGAWVAEGTARGEPLDPARHEQVVDVKAVTWHRFRVQAVPEGWRAFVVLDI
ncbi:MAG: archease, partial [Halobacteriales archaeon]|nr:archease [Halobacteriales archaeon]